MKNAVRWVVLLLLTVSLSSCFLFKKKCDCPKFGDASGKSVAVQAAAGKATVHTAIIN